MTTNPVQTARALARAERAAANAPAREAFHAAALANPQEVYPAALAKALGVSRNYILRWTKGTDIHEARIYQVHDFLRQHA